jgi:2-methylcitrate dehydratase PrpD
MEMVLNVAPEIDEAARAASAAAMRTLCDFAVSAMRRPMPELVAKRAAMVLLDDIGAMVAAQSEPEVQQAQRGLAATSAGIEATVFAAGAPRLDRYSAAAANGMAAAWCELDEGYRAAPCHAGAYLLPALLAEAEATGASVAAVLQAAAIAYEVTARLARGFPFSRMTVHPHAAYATVGAAAAAGLLRKLDPPSFLAALSGACSMTFAGPYNHAIEGALVRNAWTAAGAWVGLRATDWAMIGIGGLPETFYDVFATCLGAGCVPEELTAGLDRDWAIAGGYHKIFACCQYAHSMIEASLNLHRQLGPSARTDVVNILVETHARGLTLTGVEPATVLAAKFSMPHAAAAVARLATGGQAAFSKATLTDAAISELRRRVRLAPLEPVGAWPKDRPARVTWTMRDGAQHSAHCESARGGSDQPFDEATLLRKLGENTHDVFPEMAGRLASLLTGDPKLLSQSWARFVADITTGALR